MKITSFGLSVPASTIGTVTSSLGVRDVAMASNTIPAAGYMIVATSSNTMEWQDARAFGSNTNDVSSVGAMGAGASNARADHVHRGVHLLSAAGSNSLYGDVNLVAGAGMAITTAGQSITLASTASGGGSSSLTVEEVDGNPTVSATKLVLPNGTLGVVGTVATYTPSGGGSDLVQVASGAGSIIVPGLAGSADIRVAGANDDEFDTTDTSDPMTGWTTLQTPTAHDINSTAKSHYYVKKTATSASTGHVGIYKAWSPSAGGTVTCKMTDCIQARVNFQRGGGLFIAEASPGKMMNLWSVDAGGGALLQVTYYTAPGTYSSAPGTYGVAGQAMWPIYFRIVYNSLTSISYYFSMSGKLWTPILVAHNPGFTVGAAGLCIDTQNATYDGEAIFDWIRFT